MGYPYIQWKVVTLFRDAVPKLLACPVNFLGEGVTIGVAVRLTGTEINKEECSKP